MRTHRPWLSREALPSKVGPHSQVEASSAGRLSGSLRGCKIRQGFRIASGSQVVSIGSLWNFQTQGRMPPQPTEQNSSSGMQMAGTSIGVGRWEADAPQTLPLGPRPLRVLERTPSPVDLPVPSEAPQRLLFGWQSQPVLLEHAQLQLQDALLRHQPRQAFAIAGLAISEPSWSDSTGQHPRGMAKVHQAPAQAVLNRPAHETDNKTQNKVLNKQGRTPGAGRNTPTVNSEPSSSNPQGQSLRRRTKNLVVSQPWNRKGKGGEVWFGRPGC